MQFFLSKTPLENLTLKKKHSPFTARGKYLFFCGRGFRSRRLAQELKDRGIDGAASVMHGVSAVKKHLKEKDNPYEKIQHHDQDRG